MELTRTAERLETNNGLRFKYPACISAFRQLALGITTANGEPEDLYRDVFDEIYCYACPGYYGAYVERLLLGGGRFHVGMIPMEFDKNISLGKELLRLEHTLAVMNGNIVKRADFVSDSIFQKYALRTRSWTGNGGYTQEEMFRMEGEMAYVDDKVEQSKRLQAEEN